MFHMNNENSELMTDLKDVMKQEGSLVKELTDVATKAAGFHARLESIEKALETDPSSYSSKEADQLVSKAKDKYSNELEGNMKSFAKDKLS